MTFNIEMDDLSSEQSQAFIYQHLDAMSDTAPKESQHALDVTELLGPGVTLWTMRNDRSVVCSGALKALTDEHVELKSMRSCPEHLRQGLAGKMLKHLITEAKNRGFQRMSLETGSMLFFKPAVGLYKKHGFVECDPFDEYQADPNSLFLMLDLSSAQIII